MGLATVNINSHLCCPSHILIHVHELDKGPLIDFQFSYSPFLYYLLIPNSLKSILEINPPHWIIDFYEGGWGRIVYRVPVCTILIICELVGTADKAKMAICDDIPCDIVECFLKVSKGNVGKSVFLILKIASIQSPHQLHLISRISLLNERPLHAPTPSSLVQSAISPVLASIQCTLCTKYRWIMKVSCQSL